MKDVKKIAFVDFRKSIIAEKYFITEYLKEFYDIEIVGLKDADYVFYSLQGNKHWFTPERCVKIFYTEENLVPDFNACDYAIGFEWMEYEDRYVRFPIYYWYPYINELMENKHNIPVEKIISEKKAFCSITVSNTNRDPIFSLLFDRLSEYKKVDSGGSWKNSVGVKIKSKLDFERTHKFSIVCENSSHSGYTTEKIVEAFAANCIPIYWGDPSISKVFNPRAFINVQDYSSIDDVVEIVKRLDTDNGLYESMLMEPVLLNKCFSKEIQTILFKKFLVSIFSQPLEKAKRRNRVLWGQLYLNERKRQVTSLTYVIREKFILSLWRFKCLVRKYYWSLKAIYYKKESNC